jgi:hypothetical protein
VLVPEIFFKNYLESLDHSIYLLSILEKRTVGAAAGGAADGAPADAANGAASGAAAFLFWIDPRLSA